MPTRLARELFNQMRNAPLLISLICIAIPCLAQIPPGIDWQRCLGGSSYDVAFAIEETYDGGLLVAGRSSSSDGDVTNAPGIYGDFWVVRLDSSGTIIWEQAIGGSLTDQARAVTELSDHSIVVVGNTDSNDGDVSGNHGLQDIWAVRLTAFGTIIWQKAIGGSGNDQAQAVLETSQGNVLVAGSTFSNDGDIAVNAGVQDCWVMELDTLGNILWEKTYGGTLQEHINGAVMLADGGYVFTGASNSSNGDLSLNRGMQDLWVFRTDANGTLLWQGTFGGTNTDNGVDVATTTNGVVISGTSRSANGNITNNQGVEDMWVIAIDSTGALLWQRSLGGNNAEHGAGIAVRNDGGIYAFGRTFSNNGDVSGNHGGHDFWLVEMDSSGLVQDQRTFGGSMDDYGYDMLLSSTGSLYLTGMTVSNDGDVSGHHALHDYWVVKPGAGITTEVQSQDQSGLLVYPNPSNGTILIQSTIANAGTVSIIDAHGRMHHQFQPSQEIYQLDLQNLAPGMYLIQCVGDEGSWSERILLQ